MTVSNGKYSKVYHFDSKAEIEKYIKSIGVPATFFLPGFYMANVAGGMMHPNPDSPKHEYVLALPVPASTPFPLFDAADDTGKYVKAILKKREQTLGKRILGATDYYTAEQIVQGFKEVKHKAGQDAKFVQVKPEEFTAGLKHIGMSDLGATELTENLLFMPEFGYYGKEDLGPTLAVSFQLL